jgi:hypothetical protein
MYVYQIIARKYETVFAQTVTEPVGQWSVFRDINLGMLTGQYLVN